MSTEHDELRDLAAAYALDAADADERARIEAHLADCADCRAEVDSFRALTADLASAGASAEADPPAHVRTNVLALLEETPQERAPESRSPEESGPATDAGRPEHPGAASATAGSATTGSATAASASAEGEAAGQVESEPPRQITSARSRRSRLAVTGAALAAAAAIGIVAVVQQPWDPGPDDLTEQVLAADDARTIDASTGGSTVTLTMSPSLGEAVVTSDDLAPAGDDQVYQLWYLDAAGAPVSAGLVTPDDGDVSALLDGDATAASAAAITVEPAGGSQQPTTEPVFVFPLE